MPAMLTDSISENVAVLETLVRELLPAKRQECWKASAHIERAFNQLRRDNPKNHAVTIGAAYAIYKIAEQLSKASGTDSNDPTQGLIQLLR